MAQDKVRRVKPDPSTFAVTEREPVKLSDLASAVRQVMDHRAKPAKQSENREPSISELNQRWKLTLHG